MRRDRKSISPKLIVRLGLSLALPTGGCDAPLIKPNATATSLPIITVQSAALVGGAVSPERLQSKSSTADEQDVVYTPTNTKLQLSFRAEDPLAGIAKLVVQLEPDAPGADETVTTAAINASGLAPEALWLLGHAPFPLQKGSQVGAGNNPFNITVARYQSVLVSATNFAGRTKQYRINYSPLEPVSAHIEVTPTTISQGGKAFLYEEWHGATDVTITPTTQLLAGGVYVSPTVDTTYTMTAHQPFNGSTVGYPNANGMGQTFHPTTSTSTATVKVKSTSPPSSGSVVSTAIYLLPQPPYQGWLPYVVTWPPQGTGASGATLVSLANPNAYIVRLVKTGHTSADCGASGATVVLAQGQATTMQDDAALFYSPALPVTIIACVQNGATPPSNVQLNITYKNP